MIRVPFTSSWNGSEDVYVGSINGGCIIENIVNIGNVSFDGNVQGCLLLEGNY